MMEFTGLKSGLNKKEFGILETSWISHFWYLFAINTKINFGKEK